MGPEADDTQRLRTVKVLIFPPFLKSVKEKTAKQ
jgi:hypothetical protein